MLTPAGWQPDAIVEFERDKVRRLQFWAVGLGALGFLICGIFLGPAGIVLGFIANEKAANWGLPKKYAPMVVGGLSFLVSLVYAYFLLNN